MLETDTARTLAALNATNEAILYAKSPEELYVKVCEAAFSSEDFLAAAIFLHDPETDLLRFIAGVGQHADLIRETRISVDPNVPEGLGVCGQAFRDGAIRLSNDYLNDTCSVAWRSGAAGGKVGAAAAMPLTCNGKRVGVFVVTKRGAGSLSEQAVSLLERMSKNVSFALDNFEHEDARKKSERAARRLALMYGAISATNEAIFRAKSELDLYQRVCDAAVHSGKSIATVALLPEPGTIWLKPVAGTGKIAGQVNRTKFSIDPENPYGKGITGEAFRTQKPCVNADLVTNSGPWKKEQRESGVTAGVAVPLIKAGNSIGVLLFFVGRAWASDDEIISLFARIAENVSFALDNFDHAAEKARSDEQKQSLTRMYAALSATNEAIMRAKSRAEMYDLVCEAVAQGGRFNSVSILLSQEASDDFAMVASAGPTADKARRLTVSTSEAVPEGRGVCGTAFRSRRASIVNDFLNDARSVAFLQVIQSESARSGAAFPLLVEGRPIGVMLFISSEPDTFTSEFAELLQRLADNVSFALASFDRAEEKARTEGQKDRLARMLAALSASNEALVRARSRQELFELVCEAAATGGRFTLTKIALIRPDSDFMEFAAAAGPAAGAARETRFSINPDHPEGRGLSGMACRSGKPCIANDYLANAEAAVFHDRARQDGAQSGASFPLIVNGRVIGVMMFASSEKGTFTPEFVELLERMTDNVSFALKNFDRADEKARTEEQKERLGRMLAALSDTNEAIVRAKSPTELFRFVCEAASVGGRFTSVSIGLVGPDSDSFAIAAAAGPTSDKAWQMRISTDAAEPEGRGLSGRAFRAGKACIVNDYLLERDAPIFQTASRLQGARSGASFPLFTGGKVVGVMLFVSTERDTFTPEFVELLQRLTANISFALENFSRADEKRKADERIEYLASHDSLTGLPNREMFNGLLRHSIESSQRHARRFSLLFIDLDRFKVINDSLGHEAGDMLLVEVAHRLRAALRASDMVARLGGDEFVVVLEETGERSDIEKIASELLSALSQPMQLSGHECHTTASIGIAIYPSDGTDAQTLTKNADMAMYLAKEDGKNGFRFFSRDVKVQSIERLTLETALRRALERDQFSLHYQPKVDMRSGQVTGVEALLRWQHPDFGMVSPMQFIPLAEEIGLIVPIGRWVLKEACVQNMAWQRLGLLPVSMAVNLSPRQFADPNLLQDVDEALLASGMSPALLQLEVTESMVMRNVSRAVRVLDAIQSRGIRIAIDDFGTGHSSMSLMKQFPIDTIKIDRSFVRDLAHDPEDQAIAQAIISMGRALGMTVVAEGVETVEQQMFLREHGCDEMQGYIVSRPVPARDFAELLRGPIELASPPLQPADDVGFSRQKRAAV